MKLIIAVVRPFKMDEIVTAFEEIEGFPGMTATDVEGLGRGLGNESNTVDPFRQTKRLEIAANDDMVETIVETIRANAHTGKRGDGVIVVIPIEDAFSI